MYDYTNYFSTIHVGINILIRIFTSTNLLEEYYYEENDALICLCYYNFTNIAHVDIFHFDLYGSKSVGSLSLRSLRVHLPSIY